MTVDAAARATRAAIALAGCARIAANGVEHDLSAGQLLLVPRGCAPAIRTGPGVRYLSTDVRRGPLLPTAQGAR
jgi:hypothetical protein